MRAIVPAILLLAGCGASTDPGLSAQLRVGGAQFVPGAMPAAADGPAVQSASLGSPAIQPGAIDQILVGALDAAASAVALGLGGDRGYWVLVAGLPETEAPTLPTFRAALSFAPDLPPGPLELVARAVDTAGRFGPPRTIALTIVPPALPEGELVIHLRWDTPSDLDLRVVTPSGTEVWARHPSAYQPPPPPALPDPEAAKAAGALDLDSNGGCILDDRNQENVVFKLAPPAGHYLVRVDAASLCGQLYASWRVEVWRTGRALGSAAGLALPADTRGPHDQGAGRTALELDLP